MAVTSAYKIVLFCSAFVFGSAQARADEVSVSPDLKLDALTQFLADSRFTALEVPSPLASLPNDFVTQVRDKASDMVVTALNFLGVRYRRGGESVEAGFDCSGFTRLVFQTSLGFVLPHRADEQAKAPGLMRVQRNELRPGDLVFFNTLRRTFSHVGIYMGGDKFIHSPSAGGEVRVDDMRFAYWAKRFTGARRATAVLEPSPSLETSQRQPAAGTLHNPEETP